MQVFRLERSGDGFWGAKLVASFTDEQIAATVEAGDLPEEGASEEMVRVLIGRRDLIAQRWFSKVGSLDRFKSRAIIRCSGRCSRNRVYGLECCRSVEAR